MTKIFHKTIKQNYLDKNKEEEICLILPLQLCGTTDQLPSFSHLDLNFSPFGQVYITSDL